jgi:hypothetical protein
MRQSSSLSGAVSTIARARVFAQRNFFGETEASAERKGSSTFQSNW